MVSAGDVLVVDAADLRALGGSASRARTQIENLSRQAGAIISGLDGRGWDVGAVQGKWAGARAQLNKLANDLGSTANDLNQRATLVAFFETGMQFGIPAAGIQLLPWLMVPGAKIDGVSPVALLEWNPFWNPTLSFQSGFIKQGIAQGQNLPLFSPFNIGAMTGNWFKGGGFQEKKYEAYVKALLGSGPISKTLGSYNTRFGTKEGLGKFAASLAEQAQHVAKMGSPAGAGRKLNWVDKLDPTVGVNWQLLNANASAWHWGIGNQDNNISVEALAAHAYALAGLSYDWKRRRFSGSIEVGGSANLVDVHAQGTEHLGNSMLGETGSGTVDAAVGANAQARGDLTVDALKGKVNADASVNAMAGADVSAQATGEGDVAGAKVQATGAVTGYAGVGVKADGSVTFDPLHGKFGIQGTIAGALGLGGGVSGSVNVDLSDAPKEIWHGVTSAPHEVAKIWDSIF